MKSGEVLYRFYDKNRKLIANKWYPVDYTPYVVKRIQTEIYGMPKDILVVRNAIHAI